MTPELFAHPGWHQLDALPAPVVHETRFEPVTYIGSRGLHTQHLPRRRAWRREIFAVNTTTTPAVYRVRYRLQESIHANV